MNKFFLRIFILFFLITNQSISEENIMILKLKDGDVKIELFNDVAPNHVKRIKDLANSVNTTTLFSTELLMDLWLKQEMLSLEIQSPKILI